MTPEPSRRERERARHRSEILDVAEALLQERGVDGTTMEDIARGAQFAVGTLYRFFASKEDLVEALLVRRLQAFGQEIARIAATAPTYVEALDLVLDRHADEAPRFTPLALFLFVKRPTLATQPEQSGLLQVSLDIVAALAQLLERGVREGVLDGDPHPMAAMLSALIDGVSKQCWFTGTELRQMIPLIRRTFHDGFRRRVAPS